MNIHEYQAKELLANFGVPVLPGRVAYTADEAGASPRLSGARWYPLRRYSLKSTR
jgi:succinyl-CoA synthetase beta subunit